MLQCPGKNKFSEWKSRLRLNIRDAQVHGVFILKDNMMQYQIPGHDSQEQGLKKNFRAEASTFQIQVQQCLQQFAKAAKHIINKYK